MVKKTLIDAPHPRGSVSRRDFLAVGGLSVMGLPVAELAAIRRARERSGDRSVILILMTGGASQLETFDPKPEAPREIRGPLRAIQTAIPGVCFSEGLPHLAERANRISVLRSIYHDAAPIHETGLQLLQTGRLVTNGIIHPSVGSVVSRVLGPRSNAPAHVVVPRQMSETGVNAYRGDGPGFLGEAFAPVVLQPLPQQQRSEDGAEPSSPLPPFEKHPIAVREAYGDHPAGRQFLQARQLIERGVRFVTVNMMDRLAGNLTWDAHAEQPYAPTTLFDYRDTLCPQFDQACAGLLDDLTQRGLLDETLVLCVGEFGRSPEPNESGGRDHWTGVWSAIAAGCGLPAGQVIGASDAHAAEPVDRPIALGELTATLYGAFRINHQSAPSESWPLAALCDHAPLSELLG
jgi:uncharacterized protein (DUF1501 family)